MNLDELTTWCLDLITAETNPAQVLVIVDDEINGVGAFNPIFKYDAGSNTILIASENDESKIDDMFAGWKRQREYEEQFVRSRKEQAERDLVYAYRHARNLLGRDQVRKLLEE